MDIESDAEYVDSGHGGCYFDEEFAVNGIKELSRINFEAMSLENLMRYHFSDTHVAFMFYNWYGSSHGFAAWKSRVVRNKNLDVIQQSFVCHREGFRDEKCTDYLEKRRESILIKKVGGGSLNICMIYITIHS